MDAPNSLLEPLNCGNILPALLHSQDGRVNRRERFASVERGDITLLLPWLMGYARRTSARRSDSAREATDEAKVKRASSACRHPGCVAVAARSPLAEPRVPRNEATWERVKAKFPDEDHFSISEAAAAAMAANAFDSEEGSGPKWRPEREFDPHTALEVINSRNALSGAGGDGLRFSHLQSIIRTSFGREKFGAGIEAFWRRIIDDSGAFPPEFW